MSAVRVVRFREGAGAPRFGAVLPGSAEILALPGEDVLEALAAAGSPGPPVTVALDRETLALPEPFALLAPLVAPETWAAGLTYARSRDARSGEGGSDVYSRAYEAERPELFLKDAAGRRTVGPGEPVRVRPDSTWTLPEPELALVLGRPREIVGITIGNDVTARDIEAGNPLHLPQAKVYGGSCALGPAVLAGPPGNEPRRITCRILDGFGRTAWEGETSTGRMVRSLEALVDSLVRENPVPPGSVLLTGTALVPPDDVALAPGHRVEIAIEGVGLLVNPVARAAG